MPATSTPPGRPRLPGLRLPLVSRRIGPGAALSFVVHAAVIALVVVRGRELLQRVPAGPGSRGGGGDAVNFFAVPAAGPAALDLPAAAPVTVRELPSLEQVKVDLPPLALPQATLAALAPDAASATAAAGQGAGAAGGQGTGTGTAAGAGVGPGTGGVGSYIVPAHPRRVIPRLPACLSRGALEVRFSVAADGRPTRVEIDPPPKDEGCRREFVNLMMETQFYPATKDGQPVASVYSIRYSRGN